MAYNLFPDDEDENSYANQLKLSQLGSLTPPILNLMNKLKGGVQTGLNVPGMSDKDRVPPTEFNSLVSKMNATSGNPSPDLQYNPQEKYMINKTPNPNALDLRGDVPEAPPAPTLQSGPDIRPTIPDAPDKTSPNGGKSSILSKLFGESTPASTDEYGLQKPATHKIGILGALFGSVPALLYGASHGLGGMGLGVGLGAAGQANAAQDQEAMKNYQQNRALAQKVDYENKSLAQQAANSQATNALAKAALAESIRSHGVNEGIAQQNANTAEEKAGTPSKNAAKYKEAELSAQNVIDELDDLKNQWQQLPGGRGVGTALKLGATLSGGGEPGTLASMINPYPTQLQGLQTAKKLIAADAAKASFSRTTQVEWEGLMERLGDVTLSPAERDAAINQFKTHFQNKRNQALKLEQMADGSSEAGGIDTSGGYSVSDIDAAIAKKQGNK